MTIKPYRTPNVLLSPRKFSTVKDSLSPLSSPVMGDETKLFTMSSPLNSDPHGLSPTDSTSLWLDPNQQIFLDADSTTLWPHEPGYYPFAPLGPDTPQHINGFDTPNNHISQVDSCSSQSTSASSNTWPVSSASTPTSEADIRTSRRRAQNRVAQRTYRARKENAIKEHEQRSTELQKELSDLKTSNAKLEFGVQCLKGQVAELQQSVTWWRKIAYESRPGSKSPELDPVRTAKDEAQPC